VTSEAIVRPVAIKTWFRLLVSFYTALYAAVFCQFVMMKIMLTITNVY